MDISLTERDEKPLIPYQPAVLILHIEDTGSKLTVPLTDEWLVKNIENFYDSLFVMYDARVVEVHVSVDAQQWYDVAYPNGEDHATTSFPFKDLPIVACPVRVALWLRARVKQR